MNAKMKYFEQYDEATNIEYNLKLLDESADDDDDDEYDFFKHRKTGEFRLPQVTNYCSRATSVSNPTPYYNRGLLYIILAPKPSYFKSY